MEGSAKGAVEGQAVCWAEGAVEGQAVGSVEGSVEGQAAGSAEDRGPQTGTLFQQLSGGTGRGAMGAEH